MKIARSDPLLFRSEEDRVLVIAGSEGMYLIMSKTFDHALSVFTRLVDVSGTSPREQTLE